MIPSAELLNHLEFIRLIRRRPPLGKRKLRMRKCGTWRDKSSSYTHKDGKGLREGLARVGPFSSETKSILKQEEEGIRFQARMCTQTQRLSLLEEL